jgi:hypothetical protein
MLILCLFLLLQISPLNCLFVAAKHVLASAFETVRMKNFKRCLPRCVAERL